MTAAHVVLGALWTGLFAAAAAWGGWRWYAVEPSPVFWRLLRLAQAVLAVQLLVSGALVLAGERADDLHYVYGVLPVAVSLVAEQLRAASAQAVLDARGLPDAAAVGQLPEDGQRSVVRAILRREMGAGALGAAAVVGLGIRAALGA